MRCSPTSSSVSGAGVSSAAAYSARSSGGYGAITHALRYSDVWAAAACHSGDMGFELCYLPDMPAVLRALAGVENSIEKVVAEARGGSKASGGFRQG
jgi:hypothetical protein